MLICIRPRTITLTNHDLIVVRKGLLGILKEKEVIEINLINSVEAVKGEVFWLPSFLGGPRVTSNKLQIAI